MANTAVHVDFEFKSINLYLTDVTSALSQASHGAADAKLHGKISNESSNELYLHIFPLFRNIPATTNIPQLW